MWIVPKTNFAARPYRYIIQDNGFMMPSSGGPVVVDSFILLVAMPLWRPVSVLFSAA